VIRRCILTHTCSKRAESRKVLLNVFTIAIGVIRTLQWSGYTWLGGPEDTGDGSPQVGFRTKPLEGGLGDEAKCKISAHF